MELRDLFEYIFYVVILFYPTWRIMKRAGLSHSWAFLVLVPALGPFVAIIILAFSSWPVLNKEA